MLAAAHGQAWNASQLGQGLGLSYHTVNGTLYFLTGAFLIRRLQPLHANVGKRLVKSPKVYWRDTGLLHALMNVSDRDTLLGQPWVGASWEGFVIEQIVAPCRSRVARSSRTISGPATATSSISSWMSEASVGPSR